MIVNHNLIVFGEQKAQESGVDPAIVQGGEDNIVEQDVEVDGDDENADSNLTKDSTKQSIDIIGMHNLSTVALY